MAIVSSDTAPTPAPTRTANPYPGMPGARTAPPRQGVSPQRIIELVDARRQDSLRYNEGVFSKLQRWYDAYRGVWFGRLAQFRNNITIPFTFAMIQSDVARKVQTCFGSWPIVTFEGYSPEDSPRAKKNEILISAQMKDAESVRHACDFFLQADLCGTAIARYGWKTLKRKNRVRCMEEIVPGYAIPVVRDKLTTMFDGPVWEPVDRLDFWQQPGKLAISDMAWCIHRYYADLDDLRDDANSDDPYFDKAAVDQLAQYPLEGQSLGQFNQRRIAYRNQYDYLARQSERFAKPVEIWEMWGFVPNEFVTDGIRFRCIAIGNGRVVLKNRPSPMGNYTKPFISYAPMPDPYCFDGSAKAEIAFGPQLTANRIANQKLDALDSLIDPMYIASSSANINTQHLFTRAGRILLVDGPADDTTIRPLSPDMRGLQSAYTEIGSLFEFMQLGTGETEALLGQAGSSRETARGFLGRQENAMTRLALESRLSDEGFVEPLANAFRHMDRMWLTLPHELKILGSVATTDPVTGLPYHPMKETLDFADLEPDYRARAVGASQMIGKSVRQQNLMGLLQMMSANPALLQLVNWGNFARQAFDLFGFSNVNDLLVSQVPMVNQVASAGGMAPEQVAGAATSGPGSGAPESYTVDTMRTLKQLAPQVLGHLVNSHNAAPLSGIPGGY